MHIGKREPCASAYRHAVPLRGASPVALERVDITAVAVRGDPHPRCFAERNAALATDVSLTDKTVFIRCREAGCDGYSEPARACFQVVIGCSLPRWCCSQLTASTGPILVHPTSRACRR
jgi:hypothetical protein